MRITPNVRSTALVAVALVAVAMMMHPVTAWAADAGPATTVVDNPYGLEALWAQGDWVAKGTLAILFIMSLGTWYLGIVKLLEQSRLMREAKMARTEFWGAATIPEGALKLDEDSAFRYLADEGIKAAGHYEG